MMKLKYLFDNRNLVEMILKNWDYDQSKLDLLDYYRISANAVYPFEFSGQRYFLRFSPVEERTIGTIQAELDYIRYLRTKDYPAVDTILSKAGKELEYVETPWDDYFAVVFKGVPGKPLNRLKLTDTLITGFGQALGTLHELSLKYVPFKDKRISWREQLDWMVNVLAEYTNESLAKTEVRILRSFLDDLPVSAENYGLIHYDFELDNVFYDETDNRFHVIDFDDAVYHWFTLDIEQSIDSLVEDMPPDRAIEAKNLFIRGYSSVILIDESMLSHMPAFRRYVNLYGYIRILRSVNEQWKNEPDWMVGLRQKLNTVMVKRGIDFGIPISADII